MKPWTAAEERRAIRAARDGLSLAEIAEDHGRTKQAIATRLTEWGGWKRIAGFEEEAKTWFHQWQNGASWSTISASSGMSRSMVTLRVKRWCERQGVPLQRSAEAERQARSGAQRRRRRRERMAS